MPRPTKINYNYISNGVVLSPMIPTIGDAAKITYDGLLSKNGAHNVYAYVGYGNKWDKPGIFEMKKTKSGFETSLSISPSDRLNVCFKDCASNWDNNSGQNYVFDITE